MRQVANPVREGRWRWWWIVGVVLAGLLFGTVATLAKAKPTAASISNTIGDNVFFQALPSCPGASGVIQERPGTEHRET